MEKNYVVLDAIEKLQELHKLADDLLKECTTEYFREEFTSSTTAAAEQMLRIAPLLMESPYEFVDLYLFDEIAAENHINHCAQMGADPNDPEVDAGPVDVTEYLRGDASAVAMGVTEETTWEEFERSVYKALEASQQAEGEKE